MMKSVGRGRGCFISSGIQSSIRVPRTLFCEPITKLVSLPYEIYLCFLSLSKHSLKSKKHSLLKKFFNRSTYYFTFDSFHAKSYSISEKRYTFYMDFLICYYKIIRKSQRLRMNSWIVFFSVKWKYNYL